MKFDTFLAEIGTFDKSQLRQIDDAVLEQHRYLNHDPLVYGVKRRMADGEVHHRITQDLVYWGKEGIYHPRLWLVTTRGIAAAEVDSKRRDLLTWYEGTYEVFSIPKAEALLLPCYRVLKYDQQKEYMPQ